jgi:hypothetical protein
LSAAIVLLAAALGLPPAEAEAPVLTVVERGGPAGAALRPRVSRYLRQGEPVELSVVLASRSGLDCHAPSGGAGARFEGHACLPLPAEIEAGLRWFEARPVAGDYDNFRRCQGPPRRECADPITYRIDEVLSWRGHGHVDTGAAIASLGSHRYQVTLGSEPAPTGEAIASWPELVVRRDDSYVGYLTELVGTPFVLWPTADEVDRRLGADCVALVVYGQRRLGRRVRYVSPAGLRKLTTRVAAGRFSRDAVPGSRTPPVPVRVGDILHFGFQTAVVVEDRPPRGQLDESDLIIHSHHGVAEEVPLGSVPYAHFPFEVRRWIDRDAGQSVVRTSGARAPITKSCRGPFEATMPRRL